MIYLGDFFTGEVLDFKFNTQTSAGAPITLAGTPTVRVYKGNGTTEDDSGITLTVDFDARTGTHHVRIDTSADAVFYTDGDEFQVVLTAGTVNSQSVAGTVLAHFSLGNRPVNVSKVAGVAAVTDATLTDDVAAAVLASVVDSSGGDQLTLAKALEMLAAFIAGKVAASSGGGVTTYTYRKRDGSTASFTALCSETDGTRATTGDITP
jgi:hypothetical protein